MSINSESHIRTKPNQTLSPKLQPQKPLNFPTNKSVHIQLKSTDIQHIHIATRMSPEVELCDVQFLNITLWCTVMFSIIPYWLFHQSTNKQLAKSSMVKSFLHIIMLVHKQLVFICTSQDYSRLCGCIDNVHFFSGILTLELPAIMQKGLFFLSILLPILNDRVHRRLTACTRWSYKC